MRGRGLLQSPMSLWGQSGIFLVFGFLLFSRMFSFPWLYDDLPLVVNNPDIRSWTALLEDSRPGRIVRELSLMLDYTFFGLEPGWYRVQNILWHVLNGLLVSRVAGDILRSERAGVLAGLIFLAHPVTVEVVAQASHRKDSLALLFGLLALLFFQRMGSAPNLVRRMLWGGGVATAIYIAVHAKQNMLVLLPILLVYDYCCVSSERRVFMRSERHFRIAIVLGLIAVVLRCWWWMTAPGFGPTAAGALAKMGGDYDGSLVPYLLLVAKSTGLMLKQLLWPVLLSPEYVFPPPQGFDLLVLIGCVVPVVLFTSVFSSRISGRERFVCSWVLLFWLPTSNLLGHFSYFAADRYWYVQVPAFAMLGIMISCRVSISDVARTISSIALLLFLVLCTISQQGVWGSAEAFAARVLKVNPDALEGHITLAADHMKQGRYADALAIYREQADRHPFDARLYRFMAMVHVEQQQFRDAAPLARKAVELKGRDAENQNLLGVIMQGLGDLVEAERALKSAVGLDPRNQRYHLNLGVFYEQIERYEAAAEAYRSAIDLLPEYQPAHYNLGVALYLQGDIESAYESFSQAVKLDPEDTDALSNLATVAAETGRTSESSALLIRLKGLDPDRGERLAEELRTLEVE